MEVGLECSVCLESFQNPMTLGCGHTFCQKCLEGFQSKVCASCRKPFDMQCLNKNIALIQAMELINELKTKNEVNTKKVRSLEAEVLEAKKSRPLVPKPMEVLPVEVKPVAPAPAAIAKPLFSIGKEPDYDLDRNTGQFRKISKRDENGRLFWTLKSDPKRKSYCEKESPCEECEIMQFHKILNMDPDQRKKLTWDSCKILKQMNKK